MQMPLPELGQMPKVELHLHLDGAPRWSTLQSALRCYTREVLSDVPFWYEPGFRFASFAQFGSLFRQYVYPWLRSPNGFAELTHDVMESLIEQRIFYAEINFNVRLVEQLGHSFDQVLEMLQTETDWAASQGTIVRWFAGISRDKGIEQAQYWVHRVLPLPLFAGFDLHGIEPGYSAALFQAVFAPVREAGKKLKIHAGEMAGADSIRAAIDLGAVQIGHGLSAIQDPEVMELLRDRQIVVEMCPTSNERLGNIPSYQAHPIFEFDAAGVLATVNSDDPVFFGCNLIQELARLVSERGATPADLRRWTQNALHHAVLDEADQARILAQLDAWFIEAASPA